ncbi:ABC transporter ATP-binding protein [Bacillus sp. B1-b2]|uniref:ABC transporter ATP-binding protein n=1 Tax=Bacillus sp. B1-b2 TaxID=2653201 RepID=UPI001261EA15|nr:ABC transporter ATP-binding protein [Bacillus sp. B1-b2]KAB7672199.1 ABC transporter ATP-binding protein [Bacillus sp. B1-b2]
MKNLLEIRNLSKSFGDKKVLKDITFNVPPGSIVGFIGDNGAGKSTTFKSVLGLISKESGTIEIFGEEHLKNNHKNKEEIGVVFDAMNLPEHLTIKQIDRVFENIFNSWDKSNFNRLVNSFSLPIDKKISKFSRGMSMKLSIAVALSHNARLLLLDEATGGLDPSSREQVLEELSDFVKLKDNAILLSSHIMSDVERIASHLIIIKDGVILLNEEKNFVLENYAFIDLNEEELSMIKVECIVAKKSYGTDYRILVSDRKELPQGINTNRLTLDELSVFLTRSDSI